MLHKTFTADMTREDWLLERRKSLGGSDMGAVLGLNKYRSPYAVWADKVGILPEQPDNEAMRQGRDLEDYVARRFEEKSGKGVQRLNYILRNDSAPHLHANIDRRVIGERSGLECKTASALSMKLYAGGEFPESYYAQCVAYLAVTEWQRWYLAALVLNKGFYIYQITTIPGETIPEWCESSVYVAPDEIDALKRCAADFWECYVEAEEPPPMDGEGSTTEALKTIYADSSDDTVDLFGRQPLLRDYMDLQSEKREIERRMEAIRQTVMKDMGNAEHAFCGDFSVLWTPQSRSTFDVKAFTRDHPEADLSKYYHTSQFRKFSIREDSVR